MTAILPAIPAYIAASKDETAGIAAFKKSDAKTKSDIAYLQKVAPGFKTVDAFLKDRRAVSIVLDAYGMSANVGQTALLKKLMTQDPTKSSSLAAKSANASYMAFARAFSNWQTPPLANATLVNSVITAVATNRYEAHEDTLSAGLQDALYFKRQAPGITDVNQILANPKLLAVVTAASNLPDTFGTMDYEQQVALLKKDVKLSTFKSATQTDAYIKRFLAINEASQSGAQDPTGALAILNKSGNAGGVLQSLLPSGTTETTSSVLSLFA